MRRKRSGVLEKDLVNIQLVFGKNDNSMKAVRSGNEIAYIGRNSWDVRQELIRGHYEAQKRGSWAAFFNPKESIYEVEVFQATNQYFEEVNTFWLHAENDLIAASILEEEKAYIIAQRKTIKGRVNMAMDRGKIVRSKLFKSLMLETDCVLAPLSLGMVKVFGAVFAAYVVEEETPSIKTVLHGITDDVHFWEEAVWNGNGEGAYILSFRRHEAGINLTSYQIPALVADINELLKMWGYTRYGVEIKNDNDGLGIIVDKWTGGRVEKTATFWFEDYKD